MNVEKNEISWGILLALLLLFVLLIAAPLPALGQDSLAQWHRLDQAATVSASGQQQPAPKSQDEELPVISWEQAGEYVGKKVIVTGKVVRTHDSGKATFLNFHEDWKGKFVAVIFASTGCSFPGAPADLLMGKDLRIRGKVKMYKGSPEIVIESAKQLTDAQGNPLFDVAAEGTPQAAPSVAAPAQGVRLMTWNLENFFDRFDDPFTRDDVTSPSFVDATRMQRIADIIHQINPDVLCVEEVENRQILEVFNQAYLSDLGYQVVLLEGNDSRGIDVGMLTREPVLGATTFRHLRFEDAEGKEQHFQRDLLRVTLGGKIQADVYVVHFKSQHGGARADLVREAEAAAAVAIIQEERAKDPNYRAVITGDFNEVPEEETIQLFLRAGMIDSCAGTEKYTYNQKPYLTRIDFALLTPALAKDMLKAEVIDRVEGFSLPCASDHFPVVVELRGKAIKPTDVDASTDKAEPALR